MTVALILAQKGRDAHTASTRHSLQDVAGELVRRGVGALIVLDDSDEVVGVIGERDVMQALAAHGAAALSDEVSRHMNRDWKAARENDSIDEMARLMTIERRRHLPVLRDGRLVGVISIGDVVKWRIEQIEAERQALHHYIATA
ncbi:MAG TPA: CBS domain-containing protein [Methylocystis sp.]|nr:CBS domain-containing protein [Methylocystis sp.]HXZ14522.1 CBS domain-containing protein [Roseiarcus sp.]